MKALHFASGAVVAALLVWLSPPVLVAQQAPADEKSKTPASGPDAPEAGGPESLTDDEAKPPAQPPREDSGKKPAAPAPKKPAAKPPKAPEPPAPAVPRGETPTRDQIIAQLETQKVSIDFKNTQFEDVVDFFRETTGFNILLDKDVVDRCQNEGLKVTLQLNNVTLRNAFKLMLKMFDLNMTYQDGVLVIEPKEKEEQRTTMKIYDVRDLTHQLQDFPGPDLELKATTGDENSTLGAAFQEETLPNAFADPEFLLDLIKKSTGGATWENGNCSIKYNNGLLVVTQSRKVHREVEDFIARLRMYR